ncbi:hypothetical protein BKA67DRAFT_542464 [Truncatella angustata]|uniref:Uncharacterized protein n=1 Tax=Truncatella angustata TaxID=152316 RepID=A0A9P8UA60_9PEZI|nr:uncharacterized protein BKA67DRAFT_542464 [Truncatella angustata]KAH6639932.1 hypothetical protein BKA67DRAFT_542464 [Truncatella angustata]KAH8202421.1 hypothetical protein TruAng_003406 [Truncatella angustata]
MSLQPTENTYRRSQGARRRPRRSGGRHGVNGSGRSTGRRNNQGAAQHDNNSSAPQGAHQDHAQDDTPTQGSLVHSFDSLHVNGHNSSPTRNNTGYNPAAPMHTQSHIPAYGQPPTTANSPDLAIANIGHVFDNQAMHATDEQPSSLYDWSHAPMTADAWNHLSGGPGPLADVEDRFEDAVNHQGEDDEDGDEDLDILPTQT